MAGELKLLPFLGEGHICMQTAMAFCLVRAGLLPSFPLGIARRERRETVAWTVSKIEDGSWPVSAGQICFGKGRGSKLWATVLLSARRPHRGNFQIEAAAIRQLAGFFQGFAPRMTVSVSFSGIGSNSCLKYTGATLLAPKVAPFFVAVCDFS